jgi:hypothetical protein
LIVVIATGSELVLNWLISLRKCKILISILMENIFLISKPFKDISYYVVKMEKEDWKINLRKDQIYTIHAMLCQVYLSHRIRNHLKIYMLIILWLICKHIPEFRIPIKTKDYLKMIKMIRKYLQIVKKGQITAFC